MATTLIPWPEDSTVSGALTVVLILVVAIVVTRLARIVVRRVIRAAAKHSLLRSLERGEGEGSWWQTRRRRPEEECDVTREQRRRQRIDAAARMISHLVSVAVWITAGVAIFHLLGIDAAYFLSSAGFIGAAIAFGGQHKVNDYLTGLSVHFEDRYGVGDRIVAEIGSAEPFDGVVDNVGLFSTRLRDEHSTVHVPNHQLGVVRNLSQEASQATIRVRVPGDAGDVESALRDLAGSEGLTEVVLVGDLARREVATGEIEFDLATTRPLSERSLDRLARRVEKWAE